MKIAFRADASLDIGTGHIMRCLTLANGLRKSGAICSFVSRDLPAHLGERIRAEGFSVTLLPPPDHKAPSPPPAHAAWAGVTWQQDALETRAAVGEGLDWLVLDHYAFDARWQKAALPAKARLMVIDDLADRQHICALLLDQNLGRELSSYQSLVPPDCVQLIGPKYALLRPEFAVVRADALNARAKRSLRHLLINMGGVDAQDATSRVLMALPGADLPEETRITVIMGKHAPALGNVRSLAVDMPWATEVLVNVSDMARHMADADLAIGAAGSTTWERCALGLPSILVQIADNQASIMRAMVDAEAALDPGPPDAPDFPVRLRAALSRAQAQLEEISQNAASICDGDGMSRVTALLTKPSPQFRRATIADSRRVWEWRTASDLERTSLSGQVPLFQDHHLWFTHALNDPQRVFRVLSLGEWPCGYLRLDFNTQARARVSTCISPDAQGKGLSAFLLAEAMRLAQHSGLSYLDAEIHATNAASLRCFERAGYARRSSIGSFYTYELALEHHE